MCLSLHRTDEPTDRRGPYRVDDLCRILYDVSLTASHGKGSVGALELSVDGSGVVARLVSWPTVATQVGRLDSANLFDQGLGAVFS